MIFMRAHTIIVFVIVIASLSTFMLYLFSLKAKELHKVFYYFAAIKIAFVRFSEQTKFCYAKQPNI